MLNRLLPVLLSGLIVLGGYSLLDTPAMAASTQQSKPAVTRPADKRAVEQFMNKLSSLSKDLRVREVYAMYKDDAVITQMHGDEMQKITVEQAKKEIPMLEQQISDARSKNKLPQINLKVDSIEVNGNKAMVQLSTHAYWKVGSNLVRGASDFDTTTIEKYELVKEKGQWWIQNKQAFVQTVNVDFQKALQENLGQKITK